MYQITCTLMIHIVSSCNMNIHQYINQYPRAERKAVRERIAAACGLASESAVKHWANGTRGVPAKHFKAIVAVSGGMVCINDLLEEMDAT